jgi:hypothetical protein
MLPAVAKARVRLKCQASAEPTLTDQEIDDLLAIYAYADADGRAPDDAAWIGTWDLPEVYRQGWLLKAAKVVGDVTYSADGAQYSQSDMHRHCLEQANRYGSIGVLSVGV